MGGTGRDLDEFLISVYGSRLMCVFIVGGTESAVVADSPTVSTFRGYVAAGVEVAGGDGIETLARL